jgi:hypothetical protein
VTEAGYSAEAGAPTVSPAPGTYNVAQSVTLGTAMSGASIYYTLDGSTPTPSSTPYTAAINVSQTTTVKAIAVKAGLSDSNVVTAIYTLQVVMPTFTPAAGSYTSAQNVTISTTTSGAEIHYTTDGSTPTNSPSSLYSGAGCGRVHSGLTVRCRLDRRRYPAGRRVSDEEMATINLKPHSFHGERNYLIRPRIDV